MRRATALAFLGLLILATSNLSAQTGTSTGVWPTLGVEAGGCYEITGVGSNGEPIGVVRPRVSRRNQKCDGLTYCSPDSSCFPVTPPAGAPAACAWRRTISKLLVGTCVQTTGSSCNECVAPNVLVCMVYEYRQPGGTTDNCQNSCGLFEAMVGGNCTPNGAQEEN